MLNAHLKEHTAKLYFVKLCDLYSVLKTIFFKETTNLSTSFKNFLERTEVDSYTEIKLKITITENS